MNEQFPKGETKIFLPDERIDFEIGIAQGDAGHVFVDFIIRLGAHRLILGTTPIGASNLGELLKNGGIRAMAFAAGRGDDPILDELFPMPGAGL
jgi:hypothetical protein